MLRVLLAGLLALCGTSVCAQDHPEQDAIDEANRLGRMLFAYDQAAWHGTDAVMPMLHAAGPSLSTTVDGYIVEQTQDGWLVMFGRLAPDSSAYLIAFEAWLDPAFEVVEAAAHPEPTPRTGFPVCAGRALAMTKQIFEPPEEVRYNTAVLSAGPGRVYVYFLPAQPAVDVYHVGADVRYEFDCSSGNLIGTKRLRKALVTIDLSAEPSAYSYTSAVLTSIPTETDVFFAISRPGGEPGQALHHVITDDWVFVLDATGIVATVTREAWETIEGG